MGVDMPLYKSCYKALLILKNQKSQSLDICAILLNSTIWSIQLATSYPWIQAVVYCLKVCPVRLCFSGKPLRKYGVGIQVVRTGDFKGAVEPFISTQFSDENRVQINRLLRLRWNDYVATISKNRSLTPKVIRQKLAKDYLFKPEDALSQNLVDSIIPYDQMVDQSYRTWFV